MTNQLPNRVYSDGIWDLFHRGHLEYIKSLRNYGRFVVIGVMGDEDTINYKRAPIFNQEDRTEIIRACRYVDEVICPAPLVLTEEFIRDHQIDLVVHAFADKEDEDKQEEFFKVPKQMGIFKSIPRSPIQMSTTSLIAEIPKRKTNS